MMPRLDWLTSHACANTGRQFDRRALLLAVAAGLAGCAGPALRSQSPEDFSEAIESNTRLVGDVARPYGNNYIKIESVALDSTVVKVHPDGTGALKKTARKRSASPVADGPPRFIWLPRMLERQ